MIDVPVLVKEALRSGAYLIEYEIDVMDSGEHHDFYIANDNLVSESMTITERMCSDSILKFGLCEGSSIEFQYFGLPNITGRSVWVYVNVEYEHDGAKDWHRIPMGRYDIKECSRQASTGIIKAFGYNKLYSDYLDSKVNAEIIDIVSAGDGGQPGTVAVQSIIDKLLSDYAIDSDEPIEDPVEPYYSSVSINADCITRVKKQGDAYVNDGYVKTVFEELSFSPPGGFQPNEYYRISVIAGVFQSPINRAKNGFVKNNDGYIQYFHGDLPVGSTAFNVDTYDNMSRRHNYARMRIGNGNYNFYYDFTTGPEAYINGLYRFVPNENRIIRLHNYNSAADVVVISEVGGTSKTVRIEGNASYNYEVKSGVEYIFTESNYGYVKIEKMMDKIVSSPWVTGLSGTSGLSFILPFVVKSVGTYSNIVTTGDANEIQQAIEEYIDNILFSITIEKRIMTDIEKQRVSVSDVEKWGDVTLRDLQSSIFEINAQYGKLDRVTDLFSGVSLNRKKLYPANGLYPQNGLYPGGEIEKSDKSFYSKLWADDGNIHNYKYLIITYKCLDADGKEIESVLQRTVNPNGTDNYNVSDNWLFLNLIWTPEQVGLLADSLAEKLRSVSWFPFEMWCAGLPYVETGDSIDISIGSNTYESYILQRTMTGIQNLQDTYINGELNIF